MTVSTLAQASHARQAPRDSQFGRRVGGEFDTPGGLGFVIFGGGRRLYKYGFSGVAAERCGRERLFVGERL